MFSNPESELSRLLDESSNKHEDAKMSDSEIEAQEHLDHEAELLESKQGQTEIEIVKSLIDDLPFEVRRQLIELISEEIDRDGKANVGDSVVPEELRS